MQGVTLTVAIIFSTLALSLPPAYALAAYITALMWYPPFLAISLGTIDILVGRFVVTVLLIRCFCTGDIRRNFVWSKFDTYVLLSMIVYVGMALLNYSPPKMDVIENRGGFVMDTFFAYLAVRFIVTDYRRLKTVIKCISVVLLPLAMFGVMECVTRWQPFAPLWRFSPWFRGAAFVSEGRFGFARAVGPFSHAILFGCGFAMFLPLIYSLRLEKDKWHILAYVLSISALTGALSSMSSGPWVMVSVVIFCLMMEKYRRHVKLMIVTGIIMCMLMGIVSNRPIYHVIASWANPLGGAGFHRAKLIDLAIENFNQWWFTGYGDKDPGWGPELGMVHTDITNEFILMGVRYGIWGIIALCAVLVMAFRSLIATYNKLTHPHMKSLCWAFGSLLFSVIVTWLSVSFFGQLSTLFYCTLGMISSFSYKRFDWQVPNRLIYYIVPKQSVHEISLRGAGSSTTEV